MYRGLPERLRLVRIATLLTGLGCLLGALAVWVANPVILNINLRLIPTLFLVGLGATLFLGAIYMYIKYPEPELALSRHKETSINSYSPPPKLAEYLVWFFPKEQRDPMLGDLEEGYPRAFKKFGKLRAQLWYWQQVCTLFRPLLSVALKRLIKWGLIGWFGQLLGHTAIWEAFRRYVPIDEWLHRLTP